MTKDQRFQLADEIIRKYAKKRGPRGHHRGCRCNAADAGFSCEEFELLIDKYLAETGG